MRNFETPLTILAIGIALSGIVISVVAGTEYTNEKRHERKIKELENCVRVARENPDVRVLCP